MSEKMTHVESAPGANFCPYCGQQACVPAGGA